MHHWGGGLSAGEASWGPLPLFRQRPKVHVSPAPGRRWRAPARHRPASAPAGPPAHGRAGSGRFLPPLTLLWRAGGFAGRASHHDLCRGLRVSPGVLWDPRSPVCSGRAEQAPARSRCRPSWALRAAESGLSPRLPTSVPAFHVSARPPPGGEGRLRVCGDVGPHPQALALGDPGPCCVSSVSGSPPVSSQPGGVPVPLVACAALNPAWSSWCAPGYCRLLSPSEPSETTSFHSCLGPAPLALSCRERGQA